MPKQLKLAAVDLNLLVIFDAIMRERSVTRAGQMLGLSQPAISHALTRLRHVLKDDLFVRSPSGMVPTPRAETIAVPVRTALDGLQQSLEPVQFDAARTLRSFRVAVDNYSAVVLVAPIIRRAALLAPQITLDFRPGGTLDIRDLLDRRELDLAIGPFNAGGERFSREHLLHDHLVMAYRKGHPTADGRNVSTEKLRALARLEISSAKFGSEPDENDSRGPVSPATPVTRAPFLAAAQILATTDLVALLPLNIARNLTETYPLAFRKPSRAAAPIESAMIWPRWLDDQPAHIWLRGVIRDVARDHRVG